MQGLVPQPSQLIDELLTLSPKDRAIALSIPLAEVLTEITARCSDCARCGFLREALSAQTQLAPRNTPTHTGPHAPHRGQVKQRHAGAGRGAQAAFTLDAFAWPRSAGAPRGRACADASADSADSSSHHSSSTASSDTDSSNHTDSDSSSSNTASGTESESSATRDTARHRDSFARAPFTHGVASLSPHHGSKPRKKRLGVDPGGRHGKQRAGQHVRPRADVLRDDTQLGVLLVEGLALARGLDSKCVAHIGLPGPEELAALEYKLTQQLANHCGDSAHAPRASATAEGEAEAALAAAQAAADRLARLSMSASTDPADAMSPPTAAAVPEGHSTRLSSVSAAHTSSDSAATAAHAVVRQRLSRLAVARDQGMADGIQALCSILAGACWKRLVCYLMQRHAGTVWLHIRAGSADEHASQRASDTDRLRDSGVYEYGSISVNSVGKSVANMVGASPARSGPRRPGREHDASPAPQDARGACCRSDECASEKECLREQAMELVQELGAVKARLDCALDTVRDTELRLQTVQARALEDMQAAQLATTSAQRELRWLQAEPSSLLSASPEELCELLTSLETALGRARAAHAQALSKQDSLCPVCWELPKGMVFQCGHQTCPGCGDKLQSCPICRTTINIRIRTY